MRGRLLAALLRSRSVLCKSSVRANSAPSYSLLAHAKCFSSSSEKGSLDNKNKDETNKNSNLAETVGTKHKVFREEDSMEILDVDEERDRIFLEELEQEESRVDPFANLNLQRGVAGVFDIEDLVDLLRNEGAQQLFVVAVPPEYSYVEHIVIVTAKSGKHIQALAGMVRKVYKLKRNDNDPIPRLEGKDSDDWAALDLGNIALHIFSTKTRRIYDLETLWSVGREYDDLCREATGETVIEEFNKILANLQPAEIDDSLESGNPK